MARKAGWGSLPPRFSLNPSYLFVQNVGKTRLSRVFVFVTWNLAAASFVLRPRRARGSAGMRTLEVGTVP